MPLAARGGRPSRAAAYTASPSDHTPSDHTYQVEEEDLHELQHLLHQQRSRGAQLETDLAHARKEATTRKEVLEERTTLLRDEAPWQRP